MYKPKIGISIGSLNGIGPEIVVKLFEDPRIVTLFTPVIFASPQVVDFYAQLCNVKDFKYVIAHSPKHIQSDKINVISVWKDKLDIQPGQHNPSLDVFSTTSIIEACKALKEKNIDAFVTAPVNKSSLLINGKNFTGHTDLFRTLFNTSDALMIMASPQLKVALLTEHVPINEVSKLITSERIISTLKTFHASLIQDFNIMRPRIAVLGFNPHSGDDGIIGSEEQKVINPAIKKARESENILAFGPFSADGFWGFQRENTFDGVLAMYHDQGLIPFKMKFGDIGVNFTAALPFVRTSPDHGTAMDIAGKNIANPESMRSAVFMAVDAVRARMNRIEMYANPLKPQVMPKS